MRRDEMPSMHSLAHAVSRAGVPSPALADTAGYERLNFSELYATTGIIGLRLSEKAKDLAGRRVAIGGYMAPPLEAGAGFFVLLRAPAPACPFCDPAMRWPDDIVLSLAGGDPRLTDPDRPIEVVGILDIGLKPDRRTGAPRLVRLLDAGWRAASLDARSGGSAVGLDDWRRRDVEAC